MPGKGEKKEEHWLTVSFFGLPPQKGNRKQNSLFFCRLPFEVIRFDSIRFVSNLPSSPFSSLKQMIFAACVLVISFALFVLVFLHSLSPSPLSHSACFCARWFGLRWVCLWLRTFVAALWLNIMENGSNSFRLMKTNGQLAPQGRGRGQLQQGT